MVKGSPSFCKQAKRARGGFTDLFIDQFAEISCSVIPVVNEFKGGRPISTQSVVLIYCKMIHLKILERDFLVMEY